MTSATFTAESFSVYGIVYTVDFEYTEESDEDGDQQPVDGSETGSKPEDGQTSGSAAKTYRYSIQGGSSITLSELFQKLSIKASVSDVQNVTFTDETLVKITHTGDDWTLQSLKPFTSNEKLTITMKNGKKIVVKVTDAWNDVYSRKSFKVTVYPANSGTVWFNNNWYYTGTEVWGNTKPGLEMNDGGTNESDILAQANDGYVFDHWELNGNLFHEGSPGQLEDGTPLNVIEAGKLFIGNNDNWVVTAVYRLSSTLAVTAGNGGSVSDDNIPISNAGYNAERITATADNGYWFDHWELDGNLVELEDGISNAADGSNSIISTNRLHIGNDEGHVLHAVFVPETGFEVNASEGGSVNISSSARTKDGYNKTEIKATAKAGYWFDHWEVDGSTVSGDVNTEADGSSCTAPVGSIQVGNGEILTAVFIEEVKYAVEAVNAEGGPIGTCTVKVGEGTPAGTINGNNMNRAGNNVDSITASAGPGYVFKEWQLDGIPVLGGAIITTASDGSSSTIDAGTLHIGTEAGHKITAVFTQEYTFTVSTSPKGAGTVKDDGKTSGETIFGSMTKDGHNKYEIKATAQNGYRFSHWLMNGHTLKDRDGNELYTNGVIPEGALILTSSDNICAVFVKDTYTITVTNTGNGWTDVSTVQTESNAFVQKKASNTITAYPNNGYKFAYWRVEPSDAISDWGNEYWGNSYSAASSTIHPTVTQDTTVTAVFVPTSYRTFTVTVDDPSHGTVYGNDANRKAVAAEGVTSYVGRTRGNGSNKNDQRIQVQTTFGGFEFVGWELIRSNGRVYQSYKNNNKLAGWRIDANSLDIPEDNMALRAIFKKREVVSFDDPTMDGLIDWANGIADTDFSTNKTAEVFDYDNRIYKINMSASSKKQAIDSSVVINFITDVSRSMYFPANITEVGDYGDSYGDTPAKKLQNWLNSKSTDGCVRIMV